MNLRFPQLQIFLLTILILAVFVLPVPQLSFAADLPLGFTGQEQHSDSLLDYNARYYDADLARFPTKDCIQILNV